MMNFVISYRSAATVAVLCGLVWGTGGCRKAPDVTGTANLPAARVAAELQSNNLGELPGAVYRSQSASPIHWQPWTKDLLAKAKEANRLVFAVIAMPQQPGFQTVLAKLAADPTVVAVINNNYAPVLIDGDASREVGLLTVDLCSEIKRGLQLPLFVWMTADGNPVAWTPVSEASADKVSELFYQSHSMISRLWEDDPGYVSRNSASDNVSRRGRIALRKSSKRVSEQPEQDIIRCLRQLVSFYDPFSRSFDESGGLFPAGTIDLLATAAIHPGLSPDLRLRCSETIRELLIDLLPSAMFDPLDGGVFSSRRGKSWSLPVFYRDCGTQSRAAVALIQAFRATGDPRALDRALGLIAFTEKSFQTSEGLFSVGMAEESNPATWLWSVENIEKELPAEDAAWWIKATGMKGLGNLPSEVDPRREFFRYNSLGLGKSTAELAAELSLPVDAFTSRFEVVRKTLLKVRNSRLGNSLRDDSSHAGATFRMVSAYAAAFTVTGKVEYQEKAVALLEKARVAFADGPRLRLFSKDAPQSINAGRAFIYGLALQAALDVSDITLDEKWIDWSENLATTAAELFTETEFLKECPDDAKVIDVPVTDLVMLFDDSTAGLISLAECRLAERKRPIVATFSALATPLPSYSVQQPILHTDLLLATLARHYRVTIVSGAEISPDLKLAIERLPIRTIQRRPALANEEVPPNSIMILLPGGVTRVVSTPEALQEALTQPLTKS